MQWKPIEKYDKLKRKPRNCVFLVAESINGRNSLPQMYSLERRLGFRVITHYCVLPELPTDREKELADAKNVSAERA